MGLVLHVYIVTSFVETFIVEHAQAQRPGLGWAGIFNVAVYVCVGCCFDHSVVVVVALDVSTIVWLLLLV